MLLVAIIQLRVHIFTLYMHFILPHWQKNGWVEPKAAELKVSRATVHHSSPRCVCLFSKTHNKTREYSLCESTLLSALIKDVNIKYIITYFVDIPSTFLLNLPFPVVLYSSLRCNNSLLGVWKYTFITALCYFGAKTQYCTRHNYSMIPINAVIAGAEVALIPLTLSLLKRQCRDQIKSPVCSGSLKVQTAETKPISESRAEVRGFPCERPQYEIH